MKVNSTERSTHSSVIPNMPRRNKIPARLLTALSIASLLLLLIPLLWLSFSHRHPFLLLIILWLSFVSNLVLAVLHATSLLKRGENRLPHLGFLGGLCV